MDEPLLRQEFGEVVLATNVSGLRAYALIAGSLLPMFGVLDYLLAPNSYRLLWTFRLLATVATFGILGLTYTQLGRRIVGPLATTLVLLLSTSIVLMLWYVGGYASPYYAGLNLIVLGAGLLFTWRAAQSIATLAVVLALFEVPALLQGGITDVAVFTSNSFFLGSTAVIVVIGHAFNYRLKFREFKNAQLVLEGKQRLEVAHRKLQELDRFKSQFFANITHELKTPLAMILSPLDLFLHGELGGVSERQRSTLESMLRNGLKLLRLIGDLLDLSKLEDSRLQLRVGEHDLVAFVRGLCEQVAPLAQRKQIELGFHPEVATAPVWCDLERMERVVMNLISNATKFTPEGGHIDVTLRDRGPWVEVEVKDDGPGFPPDLAERVFERFYQVDMGGNRRYGGAGIGLALAKEIVELHGGRVRAVGVPDAGATFTVELQRDRAHFNPGALASTSDEAHAEEADAHTVDWSHQLTSRADFRLLEVAEATERRVIERDPDETSRAHTVLVVEDTPDVVRIVHQTLRQYFRVLAAPDGKKGLELAMRERPDLVITDLMMPEVDGLELTRLLRADPTTRHMPIIMLTARGDLEDRLKGIEGGVNAYLAKPFSGRELLTTVRSLLNIQQTTADILLTQRMDSLQLVTAGLAHEINNPLNYVKGAIGCVGRDSGQLVALLGRARDRALTAAEEEELARLEARIKKMLTTADSGVVRIAGTVDLMKRYSREGFARVPERHDLFAAARTIVDLVLPATGKAVKVECALEGEGRVRCVPEEFNQVISNLVQNAIEAAPPETGRVAVRGWVAHGTVFLSVKDNGPGISREHQSRLFTPFFTTKGPNQGMGLGLSICWQVTRAAGGMITVTSEPGQGAEFVLQAPAA